MVLDSNANATVFAYNEKGQLLKQTEAYDTTLARVTDYVWDTSHNRMLSVTVAGKKTSYAYAADNRIESVTQTNLFAPPPANNLDQTRVTSYSYTKHQNGILSSVTEDGPRAGSGDAVIQSFNAQGDLTSIKNGMGHEITYGGHNGLGLPGHIIGPNGDRTDIFYDARGRVTSEKKTINGVVQTKTYVYDGFGRLASVTDPDGVKHGYQYDVAGRMLSEYVSEAGGIYAQKVYTYNDMSLPLSEEIRRVSAEPAQGTVQ
jgi:YD repeat-containing protein